MGESGWSADPRRRYTRSTLDRDRIIRHIRELEASAQARVVTALVTLEVGGIFCFASVYEHKMNMEGVSDIHVCIYDI